MAEPGIKKPGILTDPEPVTIDDSGVGIIGGEARDGSDPVLRVHRVIHRADGLDSGHFQRDPATIDKVEIYVNLKLDTTVYGPISKCDVYARGGHTAGGYPGGIAVRTATGSLTFTVSRDMQDRDGSGHDYDCPDLGSIGLVEVFPNLGRTTKRDDSNGSLIVKVYLRFQA
jgi:hypothetical protein